MIAPLLQRCSLALNYSNLGRLHWPPTTAKQCTSTITLDFNEPHTSICHCCNRHAHKYACTSRFWSKKWDCILWTPKMIWILQVLSHSIQITGFRQNNGQITRIPYAGPICQLWLVYFIVNSRLYAIKFFYFVGFEILWTTLEMKNGLVRWSDCSEKHESQDVFYFTDGKAFRKELAETGQTIINILHVHLSSKVVSLAETAIRIAVRLGPVFINVCCSLDLCYW